MSVSFSTIVQRSRPSATHAASSAFRDVIAKIPPTNVVALNNGLKVATEENPLAKFATVGLYINGGTRYDKEGYSGTSRVLEKCGFLGTTNQSRKNIAEAVEELGGHLQVETGREITQLSIKVAKENVNKAVSLLADVVRNQRLADEDIKTAKDIVQSQRHEAEERTDEIVMDNLHRCAYDSTVTGLGAPIYGTEDGINAIDRKTLEEFRATNFGAGRMALVATGAVNATEFEKAATASFGDLAKGPAPVVDTRYVGGDYRLWNLRYKTSHIAWGFETCGAACEDSLPLMLASQVFGNFHRSQHELGQHAMHRVLKVFSSQDHGTPTTTHFPEKGIEVANQFMHQYSDTGLAGMYIVGRPACTHGDAGNMQEMWQWTMSEWCRISQKLLHQQELEQAKVNLKSQLLFNMDGSSNSAADIGKQVLYNGRRVPIAEMFNRIDDITVTNVQETLQHYFFARRPVYSFMGYTYPLANYEWSSMWTYKYWY